VLRLRILTGRIRGRAFASRLEVASSGFETFGDLSGTGFLPVSGLSTFATWLAALKPLPLSGREQKRGSLFSGLAEPATLKLLGS
jgi:hypothetical protein